MKRPNDDTRIALAMDIIYDADRMRTFLGMMSTPDGAVMAIKTVIGAIEQAKPIPPELQKSLAVNIYLLLVEEAQEITGKEASPKIMKKVIELALTAFPGQQANKPPTQQPQAQPAGGIVQGAMA